MNSHVPNGEAANRIAVQCEVMHFRHPFGDLVVLLAVNWLVFDMVVPMYEHDIEQSFDRLKWYEIKMQEIARSVVST